MVMSNELNLDELYAFALQVGKDAGQLLQDAQARRISGEQGLVQEEKASSVDIVTKTDEGERTNNA